MSKAQGLCLLDILRKVLLPSSGREGTSRTHRARNGLPACHCSFLQSGLSVAAGQSILKDDFCPIAFLLRALKGSLQLAHLDCTPSELSKPGDLASLSWPSGLPLLVPIAPNSAQSGLFLGPGMMDIHSHLCV